MPAKKKSPGKSNVRPEQRIRLRVICQKPLVAADYGAEFGLQDNSTTAEWKLHPGETKPNGDLYFQCECRARPNGADGSPNFLGPFVHGTNTKRFLYLSWRPKDWHPGMPESNASTWIRRIKVHLSPITWQLIDEAVKKNGVLEAKVRGTGSDGGPACASVPLVAGWSLKKS